MTPQPAVRPFDPGDVDWAVRLNNGAVPAVNGHDPDSLLTLIGSAAATMVASANDRPAGLLVLFREGADYDSLNYRWFAARYERFLYVDRVIVDPATRGAGLGRLLYQRAIALGRETDTPILTCEVNERPPNPGSMRFHEAFGFRIVGRQETESGAKAVALMAMPIAPIA